MELDGSSWCFTSTGRCTLGGGGGGGRIGCGGEHVEEVTRGGALGILKSATGGGTMMCLCRGRCTSSEVVVTADMIAGFTDTARRTSAAH